MFPVIQKSKLLCGFCIWEGNDPAAGPLLSTFQTSWGGHQGQTSTISSTLFSSLTIARIHLETRTILQAAVGDPQTLCFPQLERISTSWAMKKLMLLTGSANFPRPDLIQAPRGPYVFGRGVPQTVGKLTFILIQGRRWPKRLVSRQVEANHVAELPFWAVLRKFSRG